MAVMKKIDDLTGEVVDELTVVSWEWQGVPLVFDAGPETLDRLHAGEDITLADLIKASRVDEDAQPPASRPELHRRNQQIRDWGRENGYDVNERGRISQELRTAYALASGVRPLPQGLSPAVQEWAQANGAEPIGDGSAPQSTPARRYPAVSRRDLQKRSGLVRQWARENGYEVSDKGRIPVEVQDAYDDAHDG